MNMGLWRRLCFVSVLYVASVACAAISGSPEALPIRTVTVEIVGEPCGTSEAVLTTMQTKERGRFSQGEFDKDLKQLAHEFDRVEPTVSVVEGEVVVSLKVWKKPIIQEITWTGNQAVGVEALQKELGIARGSVYDRQGFSKAIQKLRQYYVKKGFFEIEIDPKISPRAEPNTVGVEIAVREGRAGYIEALCYTNLSDAEIDELSDLLMTKEYCLWLSWLTNQGTLHKDVFQQDEMTILRYFQNKGYLDAKVTTTIVPSKRRNDRIVIEISVEKGQVYHIGTVTISGNTLFPSEELLKRSTLVAGGIYSPEGVHQSRSAIQELYGSKGYIDAEVIPETRRREGELVYDVHFQIREGNCFRVGMIEIVGNTRTESRVILHENLLVPGAVFDVSLLKKTEERLRNIGYFKSVNIYAVKSTRIQGGDARFRDVHIEVEEIPTTARFTAFAGWNSSQGISGGVGISESNFRLAGIPKMFSEGPGVLRGGGEYAGANVTVGTKQLTYSLSWTKPYFLDTPWVVGVDLERQRNSYAADDYTIKSSTAKVFAKYPLNPFLRFGTHYRIRDAEVDLKGIKHTRRNRQLIRESKNAGTTSAVGVALEYDSTNHPVLPNTGARSTLGVEYAGLGGDHHFFKLSYLNSLFYAPTARGVLKFRMDAEAIATVLGTKPRSLPLDERLYLGGDTTMRGFRYNGVGPKFHDAGRTPRGGNTSLLLSAEYEHPLWKQLNGFVFSDVGNVWWKEFYVARPELTYGAGLRYYISDVTPLTLGFGFPVNPRDKHDVKRFFFSIGVAF